MADGFVFQPFNPRRAVVTYRHNLPHWRQDGATYFVTFRLRDSIPAHVLESWEKERASWLAAHGVRVRTGDPAWHELYDAIPERERERFERAQRRRREDFLDSGHGSCLLKVREHHRIVSDALLFFHRERCWTGDFVIMPNHAHVLITPIGAFALEGLMKSVKQHSSLEMNRRTGGSGSLWQKESYDHIVRDREELRRIRVYIEDNPRKAALAKGSFGYYRAPELDASS